MGIVRYELQVLTHMVTHMVLSRTGDYIISSSRIQAIPFLNSQELSGVKV